MFPSYQTEAAPQISFSALTNHLGAPGICPGLIYLISAYALTSKLKILLMNFKTVIFSAGTL